MGKLSKQEAALKAQCEDEVRLSTVDGKLEQIDVNGECAFRIYHPLAKTTPIECIFGKEFLEEAMNSLGRYVSVSGECYFRGDEFLPHRVKANRLEILPPTEELPTLMDLKGIAPNMTGDLSAEEFVRRQRDEWDKN